MEQPVEPIFSMPTLLMGVFQETQAYTHYKARIFSFADTLFVKLSVSIIELIICKIEFSENSFYLKISWPDGRLLEHGK